MLKMQVSINLGNDAMGSGYDVAEALHRIGMDVMEWDSRDINHVPHLGRVVNQTIFDRNGNDVGRWSIDDTEIT